MRKRLIFETLHLDVEGGVGERRTTRAPSAVALEATGHTEADNQGVSTTERAGSATVEVKLETTTTLAPAGQSEIVAIPKKVKPKKRVGFQSDRPDLYDF